MKANQVLRVAVATVFCCGTALSYAALTSTPVNVASELPTTGITLTAGTTQQLNFSSNTTNFAPSAGQSMQVNVTLDNGAKFSTVPQLKCQVTNGTTAGTANGVLNLGGAGSNNAVFTVGQAEVTAVSSGGSISACTVITTAMTVTGSHVTNNASITYQYGTLASSTENGAIITWSKGVSASIAAGTNAVALVTGGFVNLSGAVSATLLSAGAVFYRSNGSGASQALSAAVSAGDVMTTASITVSGASLAAARVTGGNYLVDATSGCGAGVAIATVTGGATSITFTGLTPTQISAGVNVCVQFSGTTPIAEGSITATLSAAPVTGYSVNTAMSPNTLATITRNGSTTRALNVPAANNADQAFIRVTNTSGIAGRLYGTLYSQDGVVLGNTNAVLADAATFVQNKTVVFDVATLKGLLGVSTDWTGRSQLVLTAETTSIRAQNLIRTSNGTLTNVGGDTSGFGN